MFLKMLLKGNCDAINLICMHENELFTLSSAFSYLRQLLFQNNGESLIARSNSDSGTGKMKG